MINKVVFFIAICFFELRSKFVLKKKTMSNSILYLTAFYPGNSGYHWRAKKWAEELEKSGYAVTLAHALNETEFNGLLKSDFSKFLRLYLKRRFKQVLMARNFETVIVQRELLVYNDYGNLFLEKLLLRIHPNAILDFDDDIAAAKKQPKKITSWYGRLMQENGNKFNESLRLYKRFIVASDYLKNKVLSENNQISPSSVLIIPTCVDYDNYPPKKYDINKKKLTLGWIGGNHNYHYLQRIIPYLDELSEKHSFRLLVIGGKTFEADANFEIEFRKWSLETEVEDLYQIDIGLMPLDNTEVAKGKGGFKLIQYMGLGIVSVASAITINKEIVDDGVNGFLVETYSEWNIILDKIFINSSDLVKIGTKARARIMKNYTFESKKKSYISFLSKGLKSAN